MTVDTLGRALALYRRTATSRSAILLIAANAIPLVGVLFFGWSLLTILVLYWLENGIVGFWNIPKIALARGSFVPTMPEMPESAALAATRNRAQADALRLAWDQARQQQGARVVTVDPGRLASVGRAALSVFFLVHYGMFWFVHGIFVFALPMFLGSRDFECVSGQPYVPPGTPGGFPGADVCGGNPFGEIVWSNVAIAGVALFLSHGASFLFNYIGRGEYLTTSPTRQMGSVYGRVVVLHMTIIFGAFAVAFLGSPIAALLVLVVLKTAFDLGLHLRERRTADAWVPADTEYGRIVRAERGEPLDPGRSPDAGSPIDGGRPPA